MKMLVILALFFAGVSGFASTNVYDLKVDLSIHGKKVMSPRIIVKAGETAMVSQKSETEESFVEVTATEADMPNNKGILLKFKVGTISKDGQPTVISQPSIVALENERAQISVSEDEGGKDLSLAVVAKRKSVSN